MNQQFTLLVRTTIFTKQFALTELLLHLYSEFKRLTNSFDKTDSKQKYQVSSLQMHAILTFRITLAKPWHSAVFPFTKATWSAAKKLNRKTKSSMGTFHSTNYLIINISRVIMFPPKASLYQSKCKPNTAHDWLVRFDRGIALFDLFTSMNLLNQFI